MNTTTKTPVQCYLESLVCPSCGSTLVSRTPEKDSPINGLDRRGTVKHYRCEECKAVIKDKDEYPKVIYEGLPEDKSKPESEPEPTSSKKSSAHHYHYCERGLENCLNCNCPCIDVPSFRYRRHIARGNSKTRSWLYAFGLIKD